MTFDTECSWASILCNETHGDRVEMISLHLHGGNLYVTIPQQTSLLAQVITNIGLYNNNIISSISSETGLLTRLTYLNIYKNIIKGVIPTEIGLLSELDCLDLDENIINGVIPAENGLVTDFTGLYLSINKLQGTIPREIC